MNTGGCFRSSVLQGGAPEMWEYMSKDNALAELSEASRLETPAEEEACAMGTLGTAGNAHMGA